MMIKESTIKRAIAEANAEARVILRDEPVVRVQRGPKARSGKQFEHLSSLQRHTIRDALAKGVRPRSLAIKYGVKTATIKRIGDQS